MNVRFSMELADGVNSKQLYKALEWSKVNVLDLGESTHVYGTTTPKALEKIIGICCDFGTIIYGGFYDA